MNSHLILRNRIKPFRLIYDLTQTELADLVGTTQNTISSLETGVYCPSAYLSGLLAQALHCKWEDLFYYESEDIYD